MVSGLRIHHPMGWLPGGDIAVYAGAQSAGGVSRCTMDGDGGTDRTGDRTAV